MDQSVSEVTNYQTNYDKIINDPIYEEIKLNKKLNEELKFSETLCNQLKNKYENLEKYCKDLQDNFNNVNNILREKQELKKKIVDLDDHNSKLVKLLVETLEEKNNIIQEKDNAIQEKDKKIQVTDNLIKEKNKELKEKDNIIQEKENLIQEKGRIIQEKDRIIQENDIIIQEKDKTIQEKSKTIQRKNKTIQAKNNEIQKIGEETETLKQKTIELENEVSKYQYALGTATDIRLLEQDINNFKKEASAIDSNNDNNQINLKKDILSLQDSLKDYTIVKGKIDINTPRIQNLLKKYESNKIITEKDQNKLLVKAVLQRHVIEQICEYAKEYFDNPDKYQKYPCGMETHLFNKTKEIVELTRNFEKRRAGIDESTKVLPIKLRQQICAALGNRGFNDMIDNKKKTFTHDFVSRYQNILNNEISYYRRINDSEKKKEIEDMAGDIIKRAVALFWFRLKVQEPVVEYIWPKSDDIIDPSYMEGKWEDDEIDNLVVDICYFPLIAQEFSNESKRQIYTKAIILQKPKPEQPPLQDDIQSAQSNKCSSVQ
ncbi:uncharacterized protein OCT59_009851 [Rhizophagus irregularis]|uniref:Uncharacterized protein n=2 Tax=Rhizophagus irregularis TaxID=588596 RepID=U9U799_RHIID|nr:hypothetical protein GLOIN_2v1678875 [Rhizophagus irregularis DAOM 181602=DAOM 197198]EXX70478.1 hypothetical protein RirG_087100 [Rhizophagus irregularis DAOM 197198w]UZO18538.1 hypothetical protein OCT59_009851 [Rhizophagus irregularis]POG64118.1 hypothetical protein GLOIN_2v1678875 [Rhizophagus irregularis DAOM 181602=DAOM 197198]CAG8440667.1 18351_t:CDS:1 [Rhizophagus irregularis]GBC29241.1 hypothetical protein GLOIN_2v1678875 [Rhizophagus irregularis DAOM 181602=DAOM 197198]|eukprot:XP_025170984.1 hypothetical protein GLOIN_2v1678875 [Rhizophagus irregularis DAOM 181602=DAOM 197198]